MFLSSANESACIVATMYDTFDENITVVELSGVETVKRSVGFSVGKCFALHSPTKDFDRLDIFLHNDMLVHQTELTADGQIVDFCNQLAVGVGTDIGVVHGKSPTRIPSSERKS